MMGYHHWHMCNMKYCDSWESKKNFRFSTEDYVEGGYSPYLDRLKWEKKRKRAWRKRKKKQRERVDNLRWFCSEGWSYVNACNKEKRFI